MKNIKNLVLGRIIPLATAGVLCLCTLGCSGRMSTSDTKTVPEVLEQTTSNTDNEVLSSISYSNNNESESLVDTLAKLEQSINRYNLLKDVKFSDKGYDELTEEEQASIDAYTPEDIQELLDLLESDTLNENEIADTMQLLYRIKEHDIKLIDEEGLSIVESGYIAAIKSEACDALSVPSDEYERVTIARESSGVLPRIKVNQDDEKTSYELHGLYGSATQDLYNLQHEMDREKIPFSEKLDLIKKGLTNIKYVLVANPEVRTESFFFTQTDVIDSDVSKSEALAQIKVR